jgi:hypothetical protein
MVTVPATATKGTVNITATAKDGSGVTDVCVINVVLFKIGQAYQGGIIAYLDATGEHGLIAAPADQSDGIRWHSGSHIEIGTTSTAIGAGKSNTEKIIQVQGVGSYAAQLCADLVLDGYDDWFLPSKDELNELYKNRNVIGVSGPGNYWSSSEATLYLAWYQGFSGGSQHDSNKDLIFRVRAVRAF